MYLTIGVSKEFQLEELRSEYLVPSLKTFFSDELAGTYQPKIYSTHDDTDDPSIQPEGIYYRIVYGDSKSEYCIQYYVYWLEQSCTDFIGISNHKYDYEPIFVFIKSPYARPVGIVNSGYSKNLLNMCRFHKTEIRRHEIYKRDNYESQCSFTTSQSPFFPFGGENGIRGTNCVKRYPIGNSIYLENERPLFGLATCFHAFSGAESALLGGSELNIKLKRLDDKIISEWFNDHYDDVDEEPFGHDVSNPFDYPYIKYVDTKPLL